MVVAPLPLDGAKNKLSKLNSGQAINFLSFAAELWVFLIVFVVFLDLRDSVF